jgi:hypothetical protein
VCAYGRVEERELIQIFCCPSRLYKAGPPPNSPASTALLHSDVSVVPSMNCVLRGFALMCVGKGEGRRVEGLLGERRLHPP